MTVRCALYISRSWAVAAIWPFEIAAPPSWIYSIENSAMRSAVPENPTYNKTWRGSDDRLRRYRHLKFFQHGGGRHLGFVRIVNSAVRSAVPENPTLEPWSESDHPLQRYGHSRMLGAHETPILGGRGGRRGSAMAPLERAMVVSYRLSIVTVALSVTIRPQFAIECLRRSNQQGVGHFGPNLGVFPLEQTRHVGVAKSEHPRLSNGEIIFEEFQPMWSQSTNVTDRRTDRLKCIAR